VGVPVCDGVRLPVGVLEGVLEGVDADDGVWEGVAVPEAVAVAWPLDDELLVDVGVLVLDDVAVREGDGWHTPPAGSAPSGSAAMAVSRCVASPQHVMRPPAVAPSPHVLHVPAASASNGPRW
jgi:hypothetical protein